jgi:hypothetical protein
MFDSTDFWLHVLWVMVGGLIYINLFNFVRWFRKNYVIVKKG